MHTPRLLHHNELLVRGMINLNRLHPTPRSREEEEKGVRKYFVTPGFSYFFFLAPEIGEREGGDNRCAPSFRERLV